GLARHVHLNRETAATLRVELSRNRVNLHSRAAGHRNERIRPAERERDRAADASTAAGDERHSQLPTSNFQLPRTTFAEHNLEVGRWGLGVLIIVFGVKA